MASDKKVYNSLDFQSNLKIKNLPAPAGGSNEAARKVDVETAQTAAQSRSNHTGTQLANTISDFDTQVRLSRLDQMAAPTADVGLNSRKITSLADGVGATDAATKGQLDTAIAGLVSGQTPKGAVKVVVSSNVNIANPGTSTLDGIAISNGDVVLLAGQTTTTQNGPYTFNGSGVAMTRAANWDSNGEAVLGSYWIVLQGTQADKFAVLTNDTAITLGTTTPTFAYIGSSSSSFSYTTTCPSVSAGASWTVTHNKGTKALIWAVYRTASPYDDIDVYGERTDTNTLTIKPDLAMASGEFTVVVE